MNRPESGPPSHAELDLGATARYVRDALARLDHLPFLPDHPLASILFDPLPPNPGVELRTRLLDALAKLRPADPVAGDSPAWRRYRALQVRYLDRAGARDTATALAVSERQARREHHEAVEALTTLLVAGGDPRASPEPSHSAGRESSDVTEAIRGIVATLSPLLQEREVSIEVDVPAELSPARVPRVPLRQAVMAVLVAGIDRGCREVAVRTAPSDPAKVGVTVTLDATAEPRAAIATARSLVRPHGGEVEARSEPSGCTITLTLPTCRATILLVDDDPDFVRLFRRCLGESPYDVVSTWEADQAVALARSLAPRVIFLDVLIPSLDGWELLARLRAAPETRETPVFICSVLREESLARALGATGYLAKPLSPKRLSAALTRCRV